MAKKILITGAGGFLGACATYYFEGRGFSVFAGVRKAEGHWRLSESGAKIALIDIASKSSVENALDAAKPDAIINFAAYGAYPTREQDETLMAKTNAEGASNLVDAAIRHNVGKFIQIGSSSEYGQKEKPMSENDTPSPETPYGKTKLEGSKIVLENAGGIDACVIRPFSPYGEWDDGKRLVPTLIRAALAGVSARLSSPRPKRDFLYVGDFNGGITAALDANGAAGEAFNIGGGNQLDIAQMAQIVNNAIPSGKPPEYGTMENPRSEPAMWQADISKAKKMLGWEPKISHEIGIGKTAEWMKTHLQFYQ